MRNCVNQATGELLKKAIENFENDSSSPVAVLYGVGGTFCAGFDLSEVSSYDPDMQKLPEESDSGHMVRVVFFLREGQSFNVRC